MKQYSVAWDLFPLNLSQYFTEIAETNIFKDATLVSDDNEEFRVHKVILSCFSETLRESFTAHHNDDITIVLPSIKSDVLHILLQFIYNGKVEFSSGKLEDVLEAGRYLKIDGMTEENVYLQDIDEEVTLVIKKEEESNENSLSEIDLKSEDDHLKNNKRNFNRIFKIDERINILCSQCDFKTTDDLEMKDHIVQNHIEEERYCHICDNRSYPTWKKFRNHMKDVHKWQIRFCNHCEFLAHSVSELREHAVEIHSNKGSDLKCNVCPRKLPSQRKLKIHVAIKHGHRIFACTQCDYKTSYRKEEIRTHIEAVHEGIRYNCEFCDYKGTTKPNLKNHISSIHENQRFYCNQCDVSSTKQGYINRHIKLDHEGFRYKCDECDHVAKTAYIIKMHKNKKHDNNFVYCDFCKFKTHRKVYLKKHQEKKHFKTENNILATSVKIDIKSE